MKDNSDRVLQGKQAVFSLRIGTGDNSWTLIFCPQSKNYYAINMARAECITSGVSYIRPAYRINPNTGNPEKVALNREGKPFLPGADPKFRKFAVKIFNGDKNRNIELAKNEGEALAAHQFFDWTLSEQGQPVIIMDFYPGDTISDISGMPNHPVLDRLSLKSRLNLIFQICNQFYEMHSQKNNKKSSIHADVKGSNILVHIVDNETVNARVIDFGSTKELVDSQAKTGLFGLTTSAIPLEAISTAGKRYISGDGPTGFLTSKSDVYSLGPVFASLLGATDPYVHRRGELRNSEGFFDMTYLDGQIQSGFNFDGALNNTIPELSFKLRCGSQSCAFTKFFNPDPEVKVEAPNDITILNDYRIPKLGYVLYNDQFLYVDKSKNKIFGRDSTNKLKPFAKKVASLCQIEIADRKNKSQKQSLQLGAKSTK